MRIHDSTQNLAARIRSVQIIVLALLSICVVRLYNLQVVHGGDHYRERAINQRLRTLSIPAPRGTILDRHGKILVDSRPVYDVVLQREKGKQIDVAALMRHLPLALDLDPEYLRERFGEIGAAPPIVLFAIQCRFPICTFGKGLSSNLHFRQFNGSKTRIADKWR